MKTKNESPTVIGIIGGGMIAQVCHIPFFVGKDGCTVKAVAESRPSLVAYLQSHFSLKTVPSHHDLLNDPEIDAVVLSAPRPAVCSLTLECLKAGKHVLTEKPMAHSVAQAEKLVKAARDKNLIYAIGFMKRYDPGVIEAKKVFDDLVQSNRLGALLSARFYDHSKSTVFAPPAHQRPLESREERFESWPLYPDWLPEGHRENYAWFMNVASHDINLLHYFFEKPVVAASVLSPNGSVAATLKQGDILISLDISKSGSGEWVEGAEFFFENGRLILEIPSPMDIYGVSRVTLIENDGSSGKTVLESGWGWSFERQAQGFIDVLANGERPATSGAEALEEMKLIEMIWRKGLEQ